ncbi:MAG: glycoside hydrolase family 3 N-terminal domain-containing protein [Actinomycetes bacterium]
MKINTDIKRDILSTFSPSFGGTTVPDWIKPFLEEGLGSITLFASNTPTFEATGNLIRELRSYAPNLIVAIDEEGGDVTRLFVREGSPYSTPALLGRCDDEALTYHSYLNLGLELSALGVDMSFAPVADVVVARENPILGVRSFGTSADLVSRHTAAAVRGFRDGGLAACIKHFPGHGAAVEDSHHHLPTVALSLSELLNEHVLPFRHSINQGVDAVMVSHIIATAIDAENPSSLSPLVINELLRKELGFTGLVVTDALDMGALGGPIHLPHSVVKALAAGADLLCFSGDTDQFSFITDSLESVTKALASGDLTQEALVLAANRVQSWQRPERVEFKIPMPVIARDLTSGLDIQGATQIIGRQIDLIELGTSPTIAAGHVAWGMRKALTERGVACTLQTADSEALSGKPIVVAFRDAYRDKGIFDMLVLLEKRYPEAIFVDLGWPTLDFAPANLIRTYGSCIIAARAAALIMIKST